jgi:hypothetical protein
MVLLVLAVLVVLLKPWKWGQAGVADDLAEKLAHDEDLATLVCGYHAAGLPGATVEITDISYGGEPSRLTAIVSGASTGGKPCRATLTMDWAMASRQSGQSKDSVAVFHNAERVDAP